MRRTHIALIQDPDKHWGFDTVGDHQLNTTCSGVKDGVRYWFEFPVTLDPIIVNGKILVPKDQIVMSEGDNLIARLIHSGLPTWLRRLSRLILHGRYLRFLFKVRLDPQTRQCKDNNFSHNKMCNDYVLIQTSDAKFKEGEGRVIRGRWKGRKVLFVGGVGIDFQSSVKYTKKDNVLWIE